MKEKLEIHKIIYKLRYVTEFLLSILFVFFLAKTLFIKKYVGYFDKTYLSITIISFIVVVLNIVYNFLKSEKKLEKIFLNIVIPLGIIYLLFIIPGHVPDETAHFIKAYDVSTGNLLTKIDENGESYITVPKGLTEYNHANIKNYSEYMNLNKQVTDYKDTEETISTAQNYCFDMYIFSALAFFIVRILNINIFFGILLARTFNFIFFLICSYFAIKKLPFGKLIFTIFMITPIFLQQVVSISADSVILSVLFYYIAYSIDIVLKKDKISKKEIIIYLIFTIIVGTMKLVYVSLAGIIFLIIKRKDLSKKQKLIILLLTIIAGMLSSGIMYILGAKYTSKPTANIEFEKQLNINSGEQIKQIINNPNQLIKAIYDDWYYKGKRYIYMSVSSELGWLEINPSETIIILNLVLFIIAALSEKNEKAFDLKDKIWLFFISSSAIILTEVAMYLGVTPVGANYILGVQGRYYLPIYIIWLMCLPKPNNYIKYKNSQIIIPIIGLILNLCVIREVIAFFL